MPKPNDPAFPVAEDHRVADDLAWTAGMTMRQYYKAHAPALPDSISPSLAESLAGPRPAPFGEMRTSNALRDEWIVWYAKLHANWAAAYADVMLIEDRKLEEKQNG